MFDVQEQAALPGVSADELDQLCFQWKQKIFSLL